MRNNLGPNQTNGQYLCKDGRFLRLIFSPGTVSKGDTRYAVLMVEDITGLLEAQEKLRKSEARYRAIVEDQTELVCRFLPDGTITFVNEAIRRYIKKTDDESVGKSFFPYLPDDDRVRVQENIASLTPQNPVLTHEHRFIKPCGNIGWQQWTNRAIFDEQGLLVEFQAVGRDITDRKEAEEALQRANAYLDIRVKERTAALVKTNKIWRKEIAARKQNEQALRHSGKRFRDISDNALAWIWEVDAAGKYTYSSPGVEKLLGYKPEEVLDKHFYDLFHPKDREKLKKRAYKIFVAKKPFQKFINANLHKNGEVVYLSTSGVPIIDENGNLLGYKGADLDITERRKAENSRKESEKNLHYLASQLLTAQEKERRRLSKELQDELGQSLLVLKLQLRLVEETMIEDAREIKTMCNHIRSYLDKVIDNVRRLSRDLSPAILEDLGLSAALRHLVRDFCRYNDMLPCSADIDDINDLFGQEAQINIYRVFQESLTNIGKYAQAKHVTVMVKKQGGSVSFLVEDDGVGFNVAQVKAGDASGKGMGLAAMEERMRMLGGTLNIWSQKGKGTRLSFTIPFQAEQTTLPSLKS